MNPNKTIYGRKYDPLYTILAIIGVILVIYLLLITRPNPGDPMKPDARKESTHQNHIETPNP